MEIAAVIPKQEIPKFSSGTLCAEVPSYLGHISFRGSLNNFGAFSYGNVNTTIYDADIGRYCSIAHDVMIGPMEHPVDWFSTSPFSWNDQGTFRYSPDFLDIVSDERFEKNSVRTRIGHDVWIGCRSFIRRGVTIGTGAVVAANSSVVKDVEPYTIVGGSPARAIRRRFGDATIGKMLASQWWDYALRRSDLGEVKYSDPETALAAISEAIANGRLARLSPLTRKFVGGKLTQAEYSTST
jgi:acetyltransferase-like isoleucine patch superfamily enzyme